MKKEIRIYQFKNGFYFADNWSIDFNKITGSDFELKEEHNFFKTDKSINDLFVKKETQDVLSASLFSPSKLLKETISIDEYNNLPDQIKSKYHLNKSEKQEIKVPLADEYDLKVYDLTKINYMYSPDYSDSICINYDKIPKEIVEDMDRDYFSLIWKYLPAKVNVKNLLTRFAHAVDKLNLDDYFRSEYSKKYSVMSWDDEIEVKDYGKKYENEMGQREIRKSNGQSYARKRYVPMRIHPKIKTVKIINFDTIDLTGENAFQVSEKINAIIDGVFGELAQ